MLATGSLVRWRARGRASVTRTSSLRDSERTYGGGREKGREGGRER